MKCRICEENSVENLIDFGKQPIVHNLKKDISEKDNLYSFRLGHCSKCNFLQLMDPIDPTILYENYFTISSWKNQPHVERLIEVLEPLSGIKNDSNIIDIGCNDGSFLLKLQEHGYSNIYGIEPTKDASSKALERNLNVVNSFFSLENAKTYYSVNMFDIVITRQVLEHIIDLDDFILGIDYILKDKGTLVIEIPDSTWNLETLDYTLWEEHVNYFTLNSLKNLLRRFGYAVYHYEVTLFSGRALTVFCEKNDISKNFDYLENENQIIKKYANYWDAYKISLRKFIESQDRPVAIYGCGARSSTFLNFTGIADLVETYIDDQPQKQHFFLPYSNVPINPWEEKYRNYLILLGVNTENEYKVVNRRKLSLKHTFSIMPPSKLTFEFWKRMVND